MEANDGFVGAHAPVDCIYQILNTTADSYMIRRDSGIPPQRTPPLG
jgi:hypothetical protein